MSDPLFTPEARWMIEKKDRPAMETFCQTLHPATVAEALDDPTIEVPHLWEFLRSTSIENQAAIFAYFPVEKQMDMAEGAGREHM
ncbi:MAG: hypothetical protein ACKO23_20565, partial [Gemmataceae bacterium]